MAHVRKRGGTPESTAQTIRAQEVLRAKKELAAYFTGRRTERAPRAALKIIKAFVKARERAPAQSRSPLPLVRPAAAAKSARSHKKTTAAGT